MRDRIIFDDSSPISRLWALRVLIDLKAHQGFVRKHDFRDDDLAHALGLDDWVEVRADVFDRKSVLGELRKQHLQAKRGSRKAALPQALERNLKQLAELAGLTDAECKLLAFTVLLKNDPLLQMATDLLDVLTTRDISKALGVILGVPEGEVRASLHHSSALMRSGLLTVDHNHHSLKHKLDLLSEDFASRAVLADTRLIDLLRDVVTPSTPAELTLEDYPHLKPSLNILHPYLRHALESGREGVNIFLHGPPGTGKTQLAKALAARLGSELFEVSCADKEGDPQIGGQRLRALRAVQCFFGKGRSLILFDEVEDVFDHGTSLMWKSTAQSSKAWTNRTLEGNIAPTFWVSNSIRGIDPAFMRRFDMVIEVAVPPRSQRERAARAICGDLVDETTLARMSDCEALAPAVVARATSVVRAIGGGMDRQQAGKTTARLIDNILSAQGHAPLNANDANRLPDTYDPAFLHADADLARIADGLAGSRSGRLCLYGPPGTGKTAYGRWLAQQLGMPLMVKRASDLLSMWVGEAEKNIATAFRTAERDGAILLIDEVDSFLRERADAQRSWEVTQVNEMLTQMETFPGIFIASTNLMDGLDQAALRRFDLKVKFDYLRPAQTVAMLQRHCERLGLAMPDAAEMLTRQRLANLTPGDFAAVMRRHRFSPIGSSAELVSALQAECAIKAKVRQPIGFVH